MKGQEAFDACYAQLAANIDSLKRELHKLNEAYSQEIKSSAGDKYETSREMLNAERAKASDQLAKQADMLRHLREFENFNATSYVQPGALFQTDKGCFYLAVGLGQLSVNQDKFFAISPVSPLGKAAKGKGVGDTFSVNGIKHHIKAIL